MNDVEIKLLDRIDFMLAKKLCHSEFVHIAGDNTMEVLSRATQKLSLGLYRGGELIGAYLVNSRSAPVWGDRNLRFLEHFKGLQGVALCVIPRERGKGYGHLLRDALPALAVEFDCDYVWGLADTRLGNREDWLSRRALLIDSPECICTAEPVTWSTKEALQPWASEDAVKRWYGQNFTHIAIQQPSGADLVRGSKGALVNRLLGSDMSDMAENEREQRSTNLPLVC